MAAAEPAVIRLVFGILKAGVFDSPFGDRSLDLNADAELHLDLNKPSNPLVFLLSLLSLSTLDPVYS